MTRLLRAATVLLALVLASCTDVERALNEATPATAQDLGRATIARVAAGDLVALRPTLHPTVANPQTVAGVRQITNQLEGYVPGEARLIGATWGEREGLPFREMVFEVPLTRSVVAANPNDWPASAWLLATIRLVGPDQAPLVSYMKFDMSDQSQAQINAFDANLGIAQSLWLLLMGAAIAFQLWVIGRVVRSTVRHKWIWVPVSLVGIGNGIINWTTGVAWFNALAVHVPAVGYRRLGIDGPLLLSVALPAGAFLALEMVRRSREVDAPSIAPAARPVVFVCEYGSKKSVLAAALFNRLAESRGLAARAVARGLNPDAEIPPTIRDALGAEGLDVGLERPTSLTPAEAAAAPLLVTFAEPQPDVGVAPGALRDWSAVPPLSEDYARARADIGARVDALIRELESERG